VQKATTNDASILEIDVSTGLSAQNLQEFINLWQVTSHLILQDYFLDAIGVSSQVTGLLMLVDVQSSVCGVCPFFYGLHGLEVLGSTKVQDFSRG
jgi:hypothetical protein